MNCSTPGFPVLHHLPEFAQMYVQWVGDAIQPSHPAIPFSSCLQSFPASGSFPVSRLFDSGGQSVGGSASASVLPMNIQGWFPLGLTGFYLLAVQGALKSFLQHHSSKVKSLVLRLLYGPILTSTHDYWKNQSFCLYRPLSAKWCLCFLIHCLGLS